ncbi:MAG TPA: hypothetical protein VLX59_08125 [Acidimicrobiales bacterium]|nr:hypothetical protein [Acidimicrobiales bacterium]
MLRNWSEQGRHHAGCILIWTLAHHEFRAISHGITRLLQQHPDPEQWHDLAVALETVRLMIAGPTIARVPANRDGAR